MDIQEITKCFSPEFKHQAIDYTHSNSHKSVTTLEQKLSVSYTILDKRICETNSADSSKGQLSSEQERILGLEKEVKPLRTQESPITS